MPDINQTQLTSRKERTEQAQNGNNFTTVLGIPKNKEFRLAAGMSNFPMKEAQDLLYFKLRRDIGDYTLTIGNAAYFLDGNENIVDKDRILKEQNIDIGFLDKTNKLSRRHLEISYNPEIGLYMINPGSTNPTFYKGNVYEIGDGVISRAEINSPVELYKNIKVGLPKKDSEKVGISLPSGIELICKAVELKPKNP